ncbi:hypothetical protein DERF_010020 [Dermatophagoides farinae]|uniref:Uncharacterized protein n=1 Tax=Dermatophagoides farinae TaxID=6954 RepID=A0A922L1J3_DERFA|nr:hypothetical protein DERF_010020 [Dermatophagoides farinae]
MKTKKDRILWILLIYRLDVHVDVLHPSIKVSIIHNEQQQQRMTIMKLRCHCRRFNKKFFFLN